MANKIRLKRGDGAAVNAYTGPYGELVFNRDTKSIHIQDGVSVGGHSVSAGESLDVPVITSPLPGLEFTEMPIVTVGKATGKDVHLATQWQVATDIDFTNVVYDTGSDENLKSAIDLSTLTVEWEGGTTYYVRARFYSGKLDSSNWSIPRDIVFKTVQGTEIVDSVTTSYLIGAVDITADGSRMAVGLVNAPSTNEENSALGVVVIYDNVDGEWVENYRFESETVYTSGTYRFGYGLIFSPDASKLLIRNYAGAGTTSSFYVAVLGDNEILGLSHIGPFNNGPGGVNWAVGGNDEQLKSVAPAGWFNDNTILLADPSMGWLDDPNGSGNGYYWNHGRMWELRLTTTSYGENDYRTVVSAVLETARGTNTRSNFGRGASTNLLGDAFSIADGVYIFHGTNALPDNTLVNSMPSDQNLRRYLYNNMYDVSKFNKTVAYIGYADASYNRYLVINENITNKVFEYDIFSLPGNGPVAVHVNNSGDTVLLTTRGVSNDGVINYYFNKVDGAWELTSTAEIPGINATTFQIGSWVGDTDSFIAGRSYQLITAK